jgi:DNA recombination protein RmuC
VAVAFVIVALVIGLALGWFFGSRPWPKRRRATARESEARDAQGQVKAMAVDLATMAERARQVELLAGERDGLRAERDALAANLAAASERATEADALRDALHEARQSREDLRADLARMKADAANFAEQKRLLIEAQEALRREFENAGNKVLERAQEAFMARAQERFAQSEEKAAQSLRALLAPVDQRLKSYEEQVGKLERERVDAFGN